MSTSRHGHCSTPVLVLASRNLAAVVRALTRLTSRWGLGVSSRSRDPMPNYYISSLNYDVSS
eukprot:266261-Amorphochlora_amoeboformis.AAC.1